jgi:hypothetical protein
MVVELAKKRRIVRCFVGLIKAFQAAFCGQVQQKGSLKTLFTIFRLPLRQSIIIKRLFFGFLLWW